MDINNIETRCSICFAEFFRLNEINGDKICDTCFNLPPRYKTLRYLWFYKGNIKKSISFMKYNPSESILKHFANCFNQGFIECFNSSEINNFDLIVPVPTSHESLKSRCFHVTDYLARKIIRSNVLRAKISSRALKLKNKNRKPQASLTKKQRIINARNCFVVQKDIVADKNILLIEDVITTGATINSAINELLKNGAKSVSVYCLARTK